MLAPYFLAPSGKEWYYCGGNDSYGLSISGLYGTSHLKPYAQDPANPQNTRVEVNLYLWGNPELGVLLGYEKYGGGYSEHHLSVGDLTKLDVWVRALHDDLMPVGLYIPFRTAWPAVKEFMDREGELPGAITWIKADDLPENTFPDPFEKVNEIKTHGYPWETDPNWRSKR